MAYYTGNFSSFATLKNSVETALQANGWGLNGDGVLEKNGMYLRLTATAAQLLLQAGTGSATGALPGAAPNGVKIMDFTGSPMNFPATCGKSNALPRQCRFRSPCSRILPVSLIRR